LPKELDQAYGDILKRVVTQNLDDAELAGKVLSWVSHAICPLQIDELQHAVATMPGATDIREDDLTPEDLLVLVCGGLITIEIESRIVRLVHYTAQKYLERNRDQLFPDARSSIALTCLTYMRFKLFDETTTDFFEPLLQKRYHLAEYALRYWADHIRGDAELKLRKELERMFESGYVGMLGYQRQLRERSTLLYRDDLPYSFLHVAAAFGLPGFCTALLNDQNTPLDINVRSRKGRTALFLATAFGRCDVMEILLGKGCNCEIGDEEGRTPLIVAVEEGNINTTKLLLRSGADIEGRDDAGKTPLSAGARAGTVDTVNVLLEEGPELEAQDKSANTPLMLASAEGHINIVRRLIDVGANLNAVNNRGFTPLVAAVMKNHWDVMKELINAGADVTRLAVISKIDIDWGFGHMRRFEIIRFLFNKLGTIP
jgi:Ankyrin repeats (3 copies)/Ankyrin repeats (many copies)